MNCDGKHPQRGFSLVELLVVLLIIGLGFSVVSFNIDDNDVLRLRIEAKQFANNTALIAEQAVLANQQWGVDIYRDVQDGVEVFGYRWLVRNEENIWQLAEQNRREVDFYFSPNLALRLELEGSDEELEILFKRQIAQYNDSAVASSIAVNDQSIVEQLSNKSEADKNIEPALWLLSSGEMSAFSLTVFDRLNPEIFVVIKGDELGRIVLEQEQSNE